MSERPSPETRSAYPHFTVIQTRWMDNDIYGHINNVNYYSYFDTVVNAYLMEQNVLDPEKGAVIGLVVETRCSYLETLSFPDIVHAGLRVARIGSSSVRYQIGLFRGTGERAVAQGDFVHVYVARQTRRPVPLPDEMRRALLPLTVA